MDGNIYSYAPPSMWNGYNEGLQAPPFTLQNYMPTSRDHFTREQSKKPVVHPSPYVFFNYSDESSYNHHHHVPENINRNQWHIPAWPKMKIHPGASFQEEPKRYPEKQLLRDCSMLMPNGQHGTSNPNISIPEGLHSSDTSYQMTVDTHRIAPSIEPHKQVSINIPEPALITNNHYVTESSSAIRKNNTRKNSSKRPKKFSKKDDKLMKKRIRDEDMWARNIRKKARSKGESYVSVQGKTVPARSVKSVDCSKCKFNCPSRVTQEEREKLFREYWELTTFKEKVDYISECIHEFAPLRPVSGRRSYSRRYTLKVNDKDERVCKEFFVTTFDISESTIVTYMAKKRKGPEAVADLRGKQTPSNKTPDSTVRLIREHILSQIGLQGELSNTPNEDPKNVKRLYQHYQTECESDKQKAASISVYRKVYSDMNKDNKDTPVQIPPDNVFSQSKNVKSLKSSEKEDSAASASFNVATSENEDDHFKSCSSPEMRVPSSSIPTVLDMVASTNSATLPETVLPSHQNVGQYSYHGGGHTLNTQAVPDQRMCSLNIPYSLTQPQNFSPTQPHSHQLQNQQFPPREQHISKLSYKTTYQVDPASSNHERINNSIPFSWDPARVGSSSIVSDHNLGYCSTSYTNQNSIQPLSSALSSSLFNYRISSSLPTSSVAAPQPLHCLSAPDTLNQQYQSNVGETPLIIKQTKDNGMASKLKKSKESKSKKDAKKRIRNEESWGRNVRKRLRFKGEAYTSVRGKLVEAKLVKKVDCSDCKFKCTSRINQEQREKQNKEYWSLDTYKKKIEFLTKYVETYAPKRKMTGRRAFSRKYTFDIDGNEERVCKDFFKATLHISESTIATALEKSRKGADAIVDMRGKHKPINKTTDETLQNIRELIIYVTGMRPHKANANRLKPEYRDINRLYQVYKYNSEKKGKKIASIGIFRNILVKEFCIKTLKPKKSELCDESVTNIKGSSSAEEKMSSLSSEAWTINLPQSHPTNNRMAYLNELPKQIICAGDSIYGQNLNIPNI